MISNVDNALIGFLGDARSGTPEIMPGIGRAVKRDICAASVSRACRVVVVPDELSIVQSWVKLLIVSLAIEEHCMFIRLCRICVYSFHQFAHLVAMCFVFAPVMACLMVKEVRLGTRTRLAKPKETFAEGDLCRCFNLEPRLVILGRSISH